MSAATENLDELVYSSRFANWDERASVRARPRRVVCGEHTQGLFFPPEAVPAARHPLVRARGYEAIGRLSIHRLHQYLTFMADLEQRAVNPACVQISRGETGLELPSTMLEDAYKIYTDEAYHAHASYDLQRQITRASGVETLTRTSALADRLRRLALTVPQRLGALDALFFVIVSETLISSLLADIPADSRLVPAVREVVADHAIDEGVHHTYFAKLLSYAWRQLAPDERVAIAVRIPLFIREILRPDLAASAVALADIGLSREEAGQVLYDTYPSAVVEADIRRDARLTMRHLRRVGVLELPEALDAFAALGLLI